MTGAKKTVTFEGKIRSVIVRLMSTYGPKLSTTMIGIHVRPYGAGWRRVFEQMVIDGTVIREAANVDGRVVFIHTLSEEALGAAGVAQSVPLAS